MFLVRTHVYSSHVNDTVADCSPRIPYKLLHIYAARWRLLPPFPCIHCISQYLIVTLYGGTPYVWVYVTNISTQYRQLSDTLNPIQHRYSISKTNPTSKCLQKEIVKYIHVYYIDGYMYGFIFNTHDLEIAFEINWNGTSSTLKYM